MTRIAATWSLAPHVVAKFPFRYYRALRDEMLIRLQREAEALTPREDDDEGNVDVRFGIG